MAPQIVAEVFEIVRELNVKERMTMALRCASYGYVLENGRVVMDGTAESLAVLSRRRQQPQKNQELQTSQALACVRASAKV